MTTLAEDLVLLAFDDESGRSVINQTYLDSAIAGALLLELVRLGRVTPSAPTGRSGHRTAVVTDPSPIGDPLLDLALSRLTAKPLTMGKAVEALVKGSRQAALDRLVERGLVRRDKSRVLGILRLTSWPAADVAHEAELRQKLSATLHDAADPDPETAALVALLHAVKALPKVIGGDKKALKARAEEIIGERWTDEAVRVAVKEVYTAVEMNAATVVAAAAAG